MRRPTAIWRLKNQYLSSLVCVVDRCARNRGPRAPKALPRSDSPHAAPVASHSARVRAPARVARAPRRPAGGAKERRARRATDGTGEEQEKKRSPRRARTALLDCGGENHPRRPRPVSTPPFYSRSCATPSEDKNLTLGVLGIAVSRSHPPPCTRFRPAQTLAHNARTNLDRGGRARPLSLRAPADALHTRHLLRPRVPLARGGPPRSRSTPRTPRSPPPPSGRRAGCERNLVQQRERGVPAAPSPHSRLQQVYMSSR